MRLLFTVAFLLGLTLLHRSAHAQAYPCSGPGPGEVVVGETQAGNGVASVPLCQRLNGSSQGAASQPQWQDRWGAIATDEPHGILGSVTGMKNRSLAEQGALVDCRAKGGKSCKLETWYNNGCATLTVGDRGYNVNHSATLELAVLEGLKMCKADGDAGCRTYFSACSPAVRIH